MYNGIGKKNQTTTNFENVSAFNGTLTDLCLQLISWTLSTLSKNVVYLCRQRSRITMAFSEKEKLIEGFELKRLL